MPTHRKVAVVFPGQGSQTADMRDSVAQVRPDLLPLALDLVGDDPFERVGDGTRFVQPAIYCASIAGWERLGRPSADLLAGHSLGEVAALVAGQALSPDDGLRVVAARGRLMQEAAERDGGGGMLAVRATPEEVEPLARAQGAVVANVNEARQVVLSGRLDALERVAGALEEAEVKAKLLRVPGGFHSPAMEAVVAPFRSVLDEVEVSPPHVPVLRCATATPFEDVRGELASALVSPVRWTDVMRALHDRGARRFLEPGPGRVLTKILRRSLDGIEATAADEVEAIRA